MQLRFEAMTTIELVVVKHSQQLDNILDGIEICYVGFMDKI